MASPFTPRVGGIVSADIAVPEHERELRFYSRVLTTGETPLWREDLSNNQGTPIIGLGPTSPDYADLPLQWMPHIQVADVAASAERAVALGGKEVMHGKDDGGKSQWAVLVDPNGAGFGVIPLPPAEAMPAVDDAKTVGHIGWVDLTVADAPATRDFYREVIGWTPEDVAMDDGAYADFNMCGGDGQPAAGVCHARGVNVGLPDVWMLYLSVGDLDESLRRVEAEGGEVIKATKNKEGKNVFAAVKDPIGVCFALMAG